MSYRGANVIAPPPTTTTTRHVAKSGEDLGLLPADMADVVHTGVIVPGQHEAEGEEAPARGLTRARARARTRAHTHA